MTAYTPRAQYVKAEPATVGRQLTVAYHTDFNTFYAHRAVGSLCLCSPHTFWWRSQPLEHLFELTAVRQSGYSYTPAIRPLRWRMRYLELLSAHLRATSLLVLAKLRRKFYLPKYDDLGTVEMLSDKLYLSHSKNPYDPYGELHNSYATSSPNRTGPASVYAKYEPFRWLILRPNAKAKNTADLTVRDLARLQPICRLSPLAILYAYNVQQKLPDFSQDVFDAFEQLCKLTVKDSFYLLNAYTLFRYLRYPASLEDIRHGFIHHSYSTRRIRRPSLRPWGVCVRESATPAYAISARDLSCLVDILIDFGLVTWKTDADGRRVLARQRASSRRIHLPQQIVPEAPACTR